jgi:hypothetical protein
MHRDCGHVAVLYYSNDTEIHHIPMLIYTWAAQNLSNTALMDVAARSDFYTYIEVHSKASAPVGYRFETSTHPATENAPISAVHIKTSLQEMDKREFSFYFLYNACIQYTSFVWFYISYVSSYLYALYFTPPI